MNFCKDKSFSNHHHNNNKLAFHFLVTNFDSFKTVFLLPGAPGNKRVVIFVDDLNMPRLDRYGSQPPIELLRQYQDFGGFYDRNKLFWKEIQVNFRFYINWCVQIWNILCQSYYNTGYYRLGSLTYFFIILKAKSSRLRSQQNPLL